MRVRASVCLLEFLVARVLECVCVFACVYVFLCGCVSLRGCFDVSVSMNFDVFSCI